MFKKFKTRLIVLMFTAICLSLLGCKSTQQDSSTDPNGSGANAGEDASSQATKTPRVFSLATSTPAGKPLSDEDKHAFEQNQTLGRGINLMLTDDETRAGLDGVLPDEKYYREIQEAGFDSVNLMIPFSMFAETDPPYELDETMIAGVDEIVNQLLDLDLVVVLYFAQYPELDESPRLHHDRFMEIWRQVADHYQNFPEELFFGVYFSPGGGTLASTDWTEFSTEAIGVIRASNPERMLVVGATFYDPNFLVGFLPPEDDRNLIITIAFFEPYRFVFQGMGDFAQEWVGTTWSGTKEEIDAMNHTLDIALKYSQQHARPVSLVAFGCSDIADSESRSKWISAVARSAEERGISWSFWVFVGEYLGAYDYEHDTWHGDVLKALIP